MFADTVTSNPQRKFPTAVSPKADYISGFTSREELSRRLSPRVGLGSQ